MAGQEEFGSLSFFGFSKASSSNSKQPPARSLLTDVHEATKPAAAETAVAELVLEPVATVAAAVAAVVAAAAAAKVAAAVEPLAAATEPSSAPPAAEAAREAAASEAAVPAPRNSRRLPRGRVSEGVGAMNRLLEVRASLRSPP
jgi:hypothetical protein